MRSKCSVRYSKGGIPCLSLLLYTLLQLVDATDDPARLVVRPDPSTVLEDSRVSFFCRSDGNPLPNVVWKINGKSVADSRFITRSLPNGLSTLRIEPVLLKDNSTLISCSADNGVASPVFAEALLTVLSKENVNPGFPTIEAHPSLKSVEQGRTAHVTCRVHGDPRPKVLWLRDLVPIDVRSESRYSVSTIGNPGALMIQNAREDDQGKYECVARNDLGVAHSRAAHLYVKVRRVPPYFSYKLEKEYKVHTGAGLNLTCVAVGYPMPRVFWKKSEDVFLGDPHTAPIGKNVLTLMNVDRSENFTCVAVSKLGNIEATTTVIAKALPPAPENVRVESASASSVTLEWNPVKLPDGERVTKYLVKYRQKNRTSLATFSAVSNPYVDSNSFRVKEVSAEMTRLTILDLEPYTLYEFLVFTVNEIGPGQPSTPREAQTGEAAPGTPPMKVQARAMNRGSVLLTWSPSEKPNGEITGYRILYTNKDRNTPTQTWDMKEVSSQPAQLYNLDIDSTYFVHVQAKNRKGFSPLSNLASVVTTQGVPGQPQSLVGKASDPRKIDLQWERPLFVNPIIRYVIWMNSTEGEKELTLTSPKEKYTVTGLEPNTHYAFKVAAESQRGRGPFCEPTVVATLPSAPAGPPRMTSLATVSSTSLHIKWQPPDESLQNGDLTKYRIRWRHIQSENVTTVTTVDSDEDYSSEEKPSKAPPPMWYTVEVPANQTSMMIEGLKPYTVYEVVISAATQQGYGPETTPKRERTGEDAEGAVLLPVPSAPRDLQVLLTNANEVKLSWEPPASSNGHLRGYYVYKEKLVNGVPVHGKLQKVAAIQDPKKTEYVVDKLDPNTEYSFRVNAFNRHGDGEFSESRTVVTGGIPPPPPRITGVTLDPPDPEDLPFKAIVMWEPPNLGPLESPIDKYNIWFRAEGKEFKNVSVSGTEKKAILTGLWLGRVYEILVAAESVDGQSENATEKLVTPVGLPDSEPVNVQYEIVEGKMRISWEAPTEERRNGNISSYRAVLTPMISDAVPVEKTVPGDERSATFSVEPRKSYMFKVSASTMKGAGPFSPVLTINPDPSVVSQPASLGIPVSSFYRNSTGFSGTLSINHTATVPSTTDEMEDRDTAEIFNAIVNRVPGTLDVSGVLDKDKDTDVKVVPARSWTLYAPLLELTTTSTRAMSNTSSTTWILNARASKVVCADVDSLTMSSTGTASGTASGTVSPSLTTLFGGVLSPFSSMIEFTRDVDFNATYAAAFYSHDVARSPDMANMERFTRGSRVRSRQKLPFAAGDFLTKEAGGGAGNNDVSVISVPAPGPIGNNASNWHPARLRPHHKHRKAKERRKEHQLGSAGEPPPGPEAQDTTVTLQEDTVFTVERRLENQTTERAGTTSDISESEYVKPDKMQKRIPPVISAHMDRHGDEAPRGDKSIFEEVMRGLLDSALVGPPTNVRVQATSNSSAVVQWDFEGEQVDGFVVKYMHEPRGKTDTDRWTARTVMSSSARYLEIGQLTAHKPYAFCVLAIRQNRQGSCSDPPTALSSLTPTYMVKDLKVEWKTSNSVKLSWQYDPPGRIGGFYLNHTGKKEYMDQQLAVKTLYTPGFKQEVDDQNARNYLWTNLRPHMRYTFHVGIRGENNKMYWPKEVVVVTDPTGPPVVSTPRLDSPPFFPRPGQVQVTLPPASEEYGPISHYWVVVIPGNVSVEYVVNMDPHTLERVTNERKMMMARQISATPTKKVKKSVSFSKDITVHEYPVEFRRLKRYTAGGHTDGVYVAARIGAEHMRGMHNNGEKFIVGDERVYDGFTNFALEPHAKYRLMMRAFAQDHKGKNKWEQRPPMSEKAVKLYTDSDPTPIFLTPAALTKSAKNSNVWLVGPLIALFVIAVLIGMLVCWWLRCNRKSADHGAHRHGSITKVALGGPINGIPSETSKLLSSDGYGRTVMNPYEQINGHVESSMDHLYPLPNGRSMTQMNGTGTLGGHGVTATYPVPVQVPCLPSSGGVVGGHSLTHPAIPIAELSQHIERLRMNNNQGFQQEFESIETGQHFTWEHSNMDNNKHKNRYANVVAYDHSRVVLSQIEGIPGSDYVNANYINGYEKEKSYIATQGPLPETFEAFWRMVWEEGSLTIVMLTNLEERSRIKCDQYWPSRGTSTYGDVQVTLVETTSLAHYTMRTLRIQVIGEDESREIRHLQYTAWPDHGVPDHPTPFLVFLKRVRILNPPHAGPIISHCSAGIGRTGAFIVIDIMLERLRYENTVDIYGCVTALRSQRSYMVQTEDQYIFIHDAVLDAVNSGSTEVPATRLLQHVQALSHVQNVENGSGIDMEFRHLSTMRTLNSRCAVANLPANRNKNRQLSQVPYDSNRVILQMIPGVEGSDYINASWVDGYRERCAYIATQGPMMETVTDFWRMVWETDCAIIVMLTKTWELGREKCCDYWPLDTGAQVGQLVVEPIAEYNMPAYILREFRLSDSQSGISRTVRHFQLTEWPDQGAPNTAEQFIDFVQQVHRTKVQFGVDGPIVVHCSGGAARTGVFVALAILIDRIRLENVVDVFTTVKLLRCERANMVQDKDHYHFLYHAALEYLSSYDQYAFA